ncbi:MAG: VWA domain-containing protein [Solirubrobacteraceae bacterium]|nr:VWA domain-containing protein [Solirubrobacteraceae bacterium]
MTIDQERRRRWQLVLGNDHAAGLCELEGDDLVREAALASLYGAGSGRGGGLERSAPRTARWLGDVREHFPASVVRIMQRDAMERLGLAEMLLEPEMLDAVQPDIHLVSTLLSLSGVIPESSRETARQVVRQVVEDLERRLSHTTRAAVTGALDRSTRTRRPRRPSEVDWPRTIRANLQHYQPEYRTIVPERLIGHGRRGTAVEREVILCIDQSGSMANSVIYSSVFGAVLASIRSLDTRLVVFDTEVVDLTDQLDDPVEVLFGVQLGGGTDINQALAYCQGLIRQPTDTIVILISDLIEGGVREQMLKRAASIVGSGAQMVALLALSDEGRPAYDHENGAALAALGVPAFACTPDLFGELMAAAIERRDLTGWAGDRGLKATPPA